MALSDQLTKLSAQAKNLEDSAQDLRAKNKAKVEQRLTALRGEIDQAGVTLGADADEVAEGWSSLQKSVSEGFANIKKRAEDRRVERGVHRADRAADNAELYAEDAIDFAVYALQEAEYYVLAAASARADADDAELQAELSSAD